MEPAERILSYLPPAARKEIEMKSLQNIKKHGSKQICMRKKIYQTYQRRQEEEEEENITNDTKNELEIHRHNISSSNNNSIYTCDSSVVPAAKLTKENNRPIALQTLLIGFILYRSIYTIFSFFLVSFLCCSILFLA